MASQLLLSPYGFQKSLSVFSVANWHGRSSQKAVQFFVGFPLCNCSPTTVGVLCLLCKLAHCPVRVPVYSLLSATRLVFCQCRRFSFA